jgi:uncharacterized protein (DUF2062 family)
VPRKLFRKYLPSHDSIREHRHLRHLRPVLKHPNLWHLNRYSVAGGMAVGLFAGMIPGPVQMITGAILAIVFRVNLPVAVAATWFTNPLTAVPLAIAAYQLGAWITGKHGGGFADFDFDWGVQPMAEFYPALLAWTKSLGSNYLIGTAILAVVFALLGYLLVRIAWWAHVQWHWRKRARARMGDKP